MTDHNTVDAEVWPEGSLEVLSQIEVDQLRGGGEGGLYPLLRRCMLAVLNSGSEMDDARAVLERFKGFQVGFIQQDRGLKVSLMVGTILVAVNQGDAIISDSPGLLLLMRSSDCEFCPLGSLPCCFLRFCFYYR